MKYYLYQITNLVNNKIYVGVHKTENLDDGYMGSGKIIRSAICKHGISNFSKVILEFFDTSEAMYAKEKEIITDEFLSREDTYNLRRGGFDYINSHIHCGTQGKRLNESLTDTQRSNGGKTKQLNDKLSKIGCFSETWVNPFIAANKELSERARLANIGTCWISHELFKSTKCKLDQLPLYIDQGWYKGRNKFLKK